MSLAREFAKMLVSGDVQVKVQPGSAWTEGVTRQNRSAAQRFGERFMRVSRQSRTWRFHQPAPTRSSMIKRCPQRVNVIRGAPDVTAHVTTPPFPLRNLNRVTAETLKKT